MPLLSINDANNKEKVKFTIDGSLYEKIKDYCTWADINGTDRFFEEAAKYVLSKDKEWKLYSKNNKSNKKTPA
ncbi:hypothetical protein BN59_03690 [Legionella massiliensis]|uniref:Uncharacterized protein n=1 Tax=Legionella massiliensis TaxID=1034943 RepID=A0A078L2C4_9GAMM|nr:hypothetical protein [Legionella massiliensis]CDZ79372.1 hypothetical protein BN59_03690 [Legionella massiliensis]CEE15110.1 hypothetical protein BN1094_03690 [Legionella massiliensis]